MNDSAALPLGEASLAPPVGRQRHFAESFTSTQRGQFAPPPGRQTINRTKLVGDISQRGSLGSSWPTPAFKTHKGSQKNTKFYAAAHGDSTSYLLFVCLCGGSACFKPRPFVPRSFVDLYKNVEGALIMLQSDHSSCLVGGCGDSGGGSGVVGGGGVVKKKKKKKRAAESNRAPPANKRHLIRGGQSLLLITMRLSGATWRPSSNTCAGGERGLQVRLGMHMLFIKMWY